MRTFLRRAGVVGLFALLAYLYLLPASRHLVARDPSLILTDGGDAVTVPQVYWELIDAAQRDPSRMAWGTVYTEILNAPDGWGLWIPLHERVLVLVGSRFLPLETLQTFVVWVLMILDGLAFYAFARVEGWRRPLALALGIAFAFSVYTRARAFVHGGLVGLYALPLAFIGLRLVQRAKRPRDLVAPALVFLAAATCSHYYVLMIAAVAPLLVWFLLRDLARREWPRALGRAAAAVAPALLFLGWNLVETAPPAVRARAAEVVQRPPVWTNWLTEFAARPSDYLVGDIAIPGGAWKSDWNPLRRRVSEYALNTVAPSNPHERSNGIRWTILAALAALLAALASRRAREHLPADLPHAVRFYLAFAAVTFLMSLAPSVIHLETDLGPSRFVNALFGNFRIPCRFGAFVHFGVLAAVGWALHLVLEARAVWSRPRAAWAAALILPAVVVLDYPPLARLPMKPLAPTFAPLEAAGPGGACGTGMFFPHLGTREHEPELYRALQRMRGTSCRTITSPSYDATADRLFEKLGFDAYKKAKAPADVEKAAVAFAKCAKLDWMVFDSTVTAEAKGRMCGELGWTFVGREACRSDQPVNRVGALAPCLLE